jgi:hypothetical protein
MVQEGQGEVFGHAERQQQKDPARRGKRKNAVAEKRLLPALHACNF